MQKTIFRTKSIIPCRDDAELASELIRLHLLHGRNSRAMNFRFDSRDQQRKQFF